VLVHLGGGLVVRVWDQEVCSLYDLRFKLGVIIFGSVRFLSKKVTKPIFFLKKTETELKLGQTDRFRFGSVFYGKNRFKLVWLGFLVLARFSRFWLGFFRFWLGFFWFGRFFWFGSVLARFFRFGSILARFGSVFSGFYRFRFGSVFSVFCL